MVQSSKTIASHETGDEDSSSADEVVCCHGKLAAGHENAASKKNEPESSLGLEDDVGSKTLAQEFRQDGEGVLKASVTSPDQAFGWAMMLIRTILLRSSGKTVSVWSKASVTWTRPWGRQTRMRAVRSDGILRLLHAAVIELIQWYPSQHEGFPTRLHESKLT